MLQVTSMLWHWDVIYSYYCSQLSHGVLGSELRSLGGLMHHFTHRAVSHVSELGIFFMLQALNAALWFKLALKSLRSQSQPCTHETSPALAPQGQGLPALGLVSHFTLCYSSVTAALNIGPWVLQFWRLWWCEWEVALTGSSSSLFGEVWEAWPCWGKNLSVVGL